MKRCQKHYRFDCVVCDPKVSAQRARQDSGGAGEIGINTDGHLTMGIGSGLTLDLQDSSLGVRMSPGFSVDTPSPAPDPAPSYDSGPSSYDSGSSSSSYDSGS
jgi:hypothetical protein